MAGLAVVNMAWLVTNKVKKSVLWLLQGTANLYCLIVYYIVFMVGLLGMSHWEWYQLNADIKTVENVEVEFDEDMPVGLNHFRYMFAHQFSIPGWHLIDKLQQSVYRRLIDISDIR